MEQDGEQRAVSGVSVVWVRETAALSAARGAVWGTHRTPLTREPPAPAQSAAGRRGVCIGRPVPQWEWGSGARRQTAPIPRPAAGLLLFVKTKNSVDRQCSGAGGCSLCMDTVPSTPPAGGCSLCIDPVPSAPPVPQAPQGVIPEHSHFPKQW